MEYAEKILNIVLGYIGKGRARRRRHVTQRHAKIGPEELFFAGRQLVQGVIVIHPKGIPDRQSTGLNSPEDDIVNEHAPQGTNMGTARGCLRVVDPVALPRPFSILGRDFITPKHASSPTCLFCLSKRSGGRNQAKNQALLCYENTKKAKALRPSSLIGALRLRSPLRSCLRGKGLASFALQGSWQAL